MCGEMHYNLIGLLVFRQSASFRNCGIYMQPKGVLLEYGESIGLRRVRPDNATLMVNIIRELFAAIGVIIPELDAKRDI